MAQTNVQIMNKMRSIGIDRNPTYQTQFPLVTDANKNEIYSDILQNDDLANKFIKSLFNMVILGRINSSFFKDKFSHARRGWQRFGMTREDIFINAAKAVNFDSLAPEKTLARYYADVRTNFYSRNRSGYGYPVSINEDELRTAFMDDYGLRDLSVRLSNSLKSGDLRDEQKIFLDLLADRDGTKIFPVHVDAITATNASDVVQQIREYTYKLDSTFGNKFNYAMVENSTPIENQLLYISAEAESKLGVYSLAEAFNLSYAEYMQKRIVVEEFKTSTGATDANTIAILTSPEYLFQYDTVNKINTNINGMHNYWNYFYRHEGLYAANTFENAIRFTTATVPAVTLTVTGADTVAPGASSVYTVTSTGYDAHLWSISGNFSDNTFIDSEGKLTVGTDEVAEKIVITATPAVGTAGTLEVTIGS